jgi:myo-inositol-1(or 4)-monophosphatase
MARMDKCASLSEWVGFATVLAAQAGEMALAGFGAPATERKADGSEVTALDVAIQEMVVRRIVERYPEHAVVGEEGTAAAPRGGDPAHARYCWVLDPLDGTRNYVRRFPAVATSLALLEDGRSVMGVVRWHHTGQVFSAVADGPALLNGVPMQVSERPLDNDLLVGAQLGAQHATQGVVAPWLQRWAVRNLGATALHLSLVACGGLDAAYAQDCRIWDLAAGILLIERAGGRCTDPRGRAIFPVDPGACAKANYPFVAGGPNAYPALLADFAARTA